MRKKGGSGIRVPVVSSTSKTDIHDITEKLLKVASKTINLTLFPIFCTYLLLINFLYAIKLSPHICKVHMSKKNKKNICTLCCSYGFNLNVMYNAEFCRFR